MLKRIQCFLRGHHEPVRQLLGFICSGCGFAGSDLGEMGFDFRVSPERKIFSRDRTSAVRALGG